MDVTGTVLAFNGRLGEWYALAAKRSGVALSASPEGIEHAFKQAYKETCAAHPCFGADDMATRDWWRTCVLRSFELADCDFTKDLSPTDADRLFQKVYSLFGSHKTYRAFPDVAPFLKWARARGIVTGVVSNADERYQDDIVCARMRACAGPCCCLHPAPFAGVRAACLTRTGPRLRV